MQHSDSTFTLKFSKATTSTIEFQFVTLKGLISKQRLNIPFYSQIIQKEENSINKAIKSIFFLPQLSFKKNSY